MKTIKAGFEIIRMSDGVSLLKHIERIARECYKSADKITDTSYRQMIRNLISRKHFAMLEHASITVKFDTDRGVTHEMVRHRLASYAQESTRYCNYSSARVGNEITYIDPPFWNSGSEADLVKRAIMEECKAFAEKKYMELLALGALAQEARGVLIHFTKASIYITCNIRQWRHILDLRAVGSTGAPHPQMEELMAPLLYEMNDYIPIVFEDLVKDYTALHIDLINGG